MKLRILFVFASLSCCLSTHLDKEWWRHTEIYDIAAWAFKDTDGDGFGDFNGVTSKLYYLKELGISTIKLLPIFKSIEEINSNYPVNDFKTIHITLGKMEDFDTLVKEANAKGIKVILDFLINHCSVSHEWFEKSRRRIDPYTDYFIWKDKDYSSTSADIDMLFQHRDTSKWTLDRTRKQIYYHYYGSNTADLNLRNEAVIEEVKKLMKFWFDKGVSGLNLLSANVYLEQFPNDTITSEIIAENHPDSYEFVHKLRKYADSYSNEKGDHERILIIDDNPNEKFSDLHGNKTFPIAHIVSRKAHFLKKYSPFVYSFPSEKMNFFISTTTPQSEEGPFQLISEDMDSYRLPNKFKNTQLIDVWLIQAYMVSEVIHIYFGQEIGLSECWIYREERLLYSNMDKDLLFQRPLTTAMHWDSSLLAGFTDTLFTLVPPNVDSVENNVEVQKNTQFSRYNMIKDLLKLRKTETVKKGEIKSYVISDYMFAFSKSYKDKETYIVVFNLNNQGYDFNLHQNFKELPEKVQVVTSSPNSLQRKGDVIKTTSSIWLRPVSSLIVVAK